MQDEASQVCASLIKAKPKDHVLDYCSGSGGKTLGFAPALEGKGQIYLHDIRENALLQAKKKIKKSRHRKCTNFNYKKNYPREKWIGFY